MKYMKEAKGICQNGQGNSIPVYGSNCQLTLLPLWPWTDMLNKTYHQTGTLTLTLNLTLLILKPNPSTILTTTAAWQRIPNIFCFYH